FDIGGVTPGNYLLYAVQTRDREQMYSAKIPFTVGSNGVAGLVAPMVQQFDFKGRVRVEGGPVGVLVPVDMLCEGSDTDEYSMLMHSAQPTPEGTFSVANMTPDRYTIRIANRETGRDGGFYLKSVRVKGIAMPNSQIDLSTGPAEDVELIL